MRQCYNLLLYCLIPWLAWWGWRRSRRFKNQRIAGSWLDRFALNPRPLPKNVRWIHAVSLGETRSIFVLVERLLKQNPSTPILITNSSISGALQTRQHFGQRVHQRMLPYDYPFAIKRFLRLIQPKQLVVVETDIWPNLYHYANRFNVPLFLVNARLKQRSLQRYQRIGVRSLVLKTLTHVKTIAVQTELDQQAFLTLGVPAHQVSIMGNLKFDLDVPDNTHKNAEHWRQTQAPNRFIWTAGSTHLGEDKQLIDLQQRLNQHTGKPLLILAPRQLDELPEIKRYLTHKNIPYQCRSALKQQPLSASTQVLFIDSFGELMQWYATSDLVFIGGSLIPFGGHSFIEAAWLRKPIVTGPHVNNLKNLYDPAIQAQAVTQTADIQALESHLTQALDQPETLKDQGEKAHQFARQHAGACQRLLEIIRY